MSFELKKGHATNYTPAIVNGLSAAVMIACAVIVIQESKHPTYITIDESRDLGFLIQADGSAATEYSRAKSLLLNVGAIIASSCPFEADKETKAKQYLESFVNSREVREQIMTARREVQDSKPQGMVLEPVLRALRDKRVQIFQSGSNRGMVANLTWSLIEAGGRRPVIDLTAGCTLTRTQVSLLNPFGYGLASFERMNTRIYQEDKQ